MTKQWTLYDAAGNTVIVNGLALSLTYTLDGDAGHANLSSRVTKAVCECDATDTVTAAFAPDTNHGIDLAEDKTRVSKVPTGLTDASWNPSTGSSVTLTFDATNGGSWDFTPKSDKASVGLRLKVVVKRPTG